MVADAQRNSHGGPPSQQQQQQQQQQQGLDTLGHLGAVGVLRDRIEQVRFCREPVTPDR
jgi:hypothetical protein